MPMNAVVGGTPHYVLMDGKQRIGPKVIPLPAGVEYAPIYGFSDKRAYDKFCANSQLALKPYPLVEDYLRNQADAPGDGLKFVVLDAIEPHEPCLHVATTEAVLEAQEKRTTHVAAEYRLLFDQDANAYRMEAAQ